MDPTNARGWAGIDQDETTSERDYFIGTETNSVVVDNFFEDSRYFGGSDGHYSALGMHVEVTDQGIEYDVNEDIDDKVVMEFVEGIVRQFHDVDQEFVPEVEQGIYEQAGDVVAADGGTSEIVPEKDKYVAMELRNGDEVEGRVDFAMPFGSGKSGRVQIEGEPMSYRVDPEDPTAPHQVVDWEYAEPEAETPEQVAADGGATIADVDHTGPGITGSQRTMKRGVEYSPGIGVKETVDEDAEETYTDAREQFSVAASFGTGGDWDSGTPNKEDSETVHDEWGTIP